ncbi:MAG: ATP-dependent helicase [Planctomycetaceae bacterium]|jgi:DNA helicase-2/ATP-dependent DNA helicase PcrA|nr:ATP-dependent helicase [Planctomycetaceae bacterium]
MKKTIKKTVKKTVKKSVEKTVKPAQKTSPKSSKTSQSLQQSGSLNREQKKAVAHSGGPLLIIAGAGTGKTKTLVHRVARLIEQGMPPSRILLLTFTRRAAAEMLHRVDEVLRQANTKTSSGNHHGIWGGTFHAVATRLLRMYGAAIGLPHDFTILDRGDSEDLIGTIRAEMKLDKATLKFPKKGTCMTIYSLHVNSRVPVVELVAKRFPWLKSHTEKLAQLFKTYEKRKLAAATLDYDDLLLYWLKLLENKESAEKIVNRFDHVLVDEYQDTNIVQSDILKLLCPKDKGLTVVGDDAQSIYSFRAATIRNILDFPKQFPNTTVITLEQNYRSTPTILKTTNQVIDIAKERYTKNLRSDQKPSVQPVLLRCYNDEAQVNFVIGEILRLKSKGIPFKNQAVLFRASHHSLLLETELARKKIPFHKHGGLKFVESAHLKDLIAFLRFAENQRDETAAVRSLSLLSGIGTKKALVLAQGFVAAGDFAQGLAKWKKWKPPQSTGNMWTKFLKLFEELTNGSLPLEKQIAAALEFYTPILEEKYDDYDYKKRLDDLEQLREIALKFKDRTEMLTDLTLDPPSSTEELPNRNTDKMNDYLTLSTIHSAKGLEWNSVFVIHASDGFIPSYKATDTEGIEEELRLFYVALTRAQQHLYICSPRYFFSNFNSWSNDDGYRDISRFINYKVKKTLQEKKV